MASVSVREELARMLRRASYIGWNFMKSSMFVDRHIATSGEEQAKMLAGLGYDSLDDLTTAALPESISISERLQVFGPLSETDALAQLQAISQKNKVYTSLLGEGWNDCITPAVIRRNMIENPAWYTAYTPYQPEISQGRLEMLLTFQTMISDLTGCELANASMLDEATAAAEAMTMLARVNKSSSSKKFFVDADSHRQTLAVLQTRAQPLGIDITVGDPQTELAAEEYFGVFLTHPGSSGALREIAPVIATCHEGGALVAVSTDLLACCIVKAPGELGADVVVGSAQRFGVPLGFGGPNAGFIATQQKYARSLPGRIVGVSKDSNGDVAYRLALQTREQHIRREKATSNICTAQALLANVATAYACWHGPDGLRQIASRTHQLAASFAAALRSGGFAVTDNFFDTVTITTDEAATFVAKAAEKEINLRLGDNNHVTISFDETSTVELVAVLASIFTCSEHLVIADVIAGSASASLPEAQRRTSTYLQHPNFLSYHSEHEMLRWLRKLSDKDLALDRTMIPLGSCTMKLNAAAEMEPISWPEFANIHPYAPSEQTIGYRELIDDLEKALADATGYHSVSLQPNAGSQGEYAGLLAIAAWHKSQGESQRNVCLIPSSAHGTNAASAVMAGMKVVVVVACDDKGNIDLADLQAKIEQTGDKFSALMITYPSTHGVYEETVSQVCAMVHDAGGQVYTDGANLNALVGIAKPGKFGSDVSHLNLHKTFCIPHGGGGPGVGPVAVAEHLAPFLPGHSVVEVAGADDIVVSSAPWGSASILPISWMYIAMMGPDGLKKATQAAVLAANYLATKLSDNYTVLYRGQNGLVAHECIIDIRPITADCGVTNDDIAKRLADYGFHAPTMSFPIPGTLMIEPTESESLVELDRFCEAMAAIAAEIGEVSDGKVAVEDSVLRHAPHTAQSLLADDWDRAYSRSQAAYPVASLRQRSYFAPVGRIDNAHGDRNLICSCPPLDSYE